MAAAARAAPAVSDTSSGSVGHSACHPPSPRSCSCGIAASIVATRPGARTAAASTTDACTGFCLCGIADEWPPFPSAASPTSVCASSDTSRAILPSVPHVTPSAHAHRAKRSRCACQGIAGDVRPSREARRSETSRPRSPSDASVPDAPPNWRTRTSSSAAASAARWRATASSQPAAFTPKVIGVDC